MSKINSLKTYYMIFSILNATASSPISGKKLAEELALSEKSIQTQLTLVKDYCIEHGFEIIAKSGKGFYCKIIDIQKVTPLRERLNIYFSLNYVITNNRDNALRFADFLIYIVSLDIPVSINDICRKFYLSKSTVYSYISKGKEWLDYTSGIQMIKDSANRISSTANEYKKRIFISFNTANSLDHNDFKNSLGYNFQYIIESPEKTKIVYDMLSLYGFGLSDEHFRVFLMLLSYSDVLFSYKYTISGFFPSEIKHIQSLSEYAFIVELVQKLGLSYTGNKEELSLLSAFILIFNNNRGEISEERYGYVFFKGIMDLYHNIHSYLSELIPDFFRNFPENGALYNLSARLYFLHLFDLYKYNYTAVDMNMIHGANAMIRYIARLITNVVEKYYSAPLSHRNASIVCRYCTEILRSIKPVKSVVNILLILDDAGAFNSHLKNYLMTYLTPAPPIIREMTLYEATRCDLSNYDLILTNYPKLDYIQNNRRVYQFSEPIYRRLDFAERYQQLTVMGEITAGKVKSLFEVINIYHDCQIENTKDFLLKLDNDLDGDGNIPIRMLRKLGTPINYYGDNQLLIVPFIYKDIQEHKSILQIYFNKKEKNPKYKTLVFFSIYSDYTPQSLLKLLTLCDEFCLTPTIFHEIADC